MTFGAAFACAYRRDLARLTRKEIVKRSQQQTSTPVTASQGQSNAMSTTVAVTTDPEPEIKEEKFKDEDFLEINGKFGPWFLGPW